MNTEQAEFMKKAFPILIGLTEDPLAPFKFEKAYNALEQLGRMLAYEKIAKESEVDDIQKKLLESLDEDFVVNAAFIIALAAFLNVAIKEFISNAVQQGHKLNG
jgi:hypothetical protein